MGKGKIWTDYYLNKFRWYRKYRGGTWYKHKFTGDALQLSVTYGKINRYSDVVKIENW